MDHLNYDTEKFIFLKRTHHRHEGGGYEFWLIKHKQGNYFYEADIRIPGIINDDELILEDQKEKVCIVDFYTEDDVPYKENVEPTNDKNYSATTIVSSVADLTIKILEPIRKFRYVAIICNKQYVDMYNSLINKFGAHASEDIVNKTIKILKPEIQYNIDMGVQFCIVGDLFTNDVWQKNNIVSK